MEFSVEGALVCGGALAARVRRETEVFLEEKAHEKRRTHPLFYAFCCGAGALCAVFGLFAGMLLPYSAAAMAVAGRDTMMGSSLFGMTAELLRGSLPAADSAYSLLLALFLAAAAFSALAARAAADAKPALSSTSSASRARMPSRSCAFSRRASTRSALAARNARSCPAAG